MGANGMAGEGNKFFDMLAGAVVSGAIRALKSQKWTASTQIAGVAER